MPPALLRRSLSRRFVIASVVVLMALTASVTWLRFHAADIELDINTGTARRPLVAVQGKVTQMPSGDYLAANTLVDTSACSATNVIKWDGTQFACGSGGGGGSGGGITNTAPNRTVMMSDGTNAVPSPLTFDGTSGMNLGSAGLTIGVSSGSPTLEPLTLNGIFTINNGTTNDFMVDPNSVGYIDTVVGPSVHGSGTDETFCVGWTCGAFPLRGSLDVRTNGNTIIASASNSSAAFISNTDTVNTGSSPRNSFGLDVENVSGRGTGTGALTTYGIRVDNPGNGQTNYGIDIVRSGLRVEAGGASVLAGTTAVQALTATTIAATGAISSSASVTVGSTVLNTANLTTSTINVNNAQIFGGSSNTDYYIPSASNQVLNFYASGTGAINFQSNVDGIANAGTGGVNFGPGNNSALLGTRIPGTGEIRDVGTLPTLSGCGTAPTKTGGGYSGRITTDTGATTCVVTFATALHTTGTCMIMDEAGSVPAFTTTTTALSFTAASSHSYQYECMGH